MAEGFVVIPAVDVLSGRAVRLERGDFRSITNDAGDPLALVARAAAGRPAFVHVVALDAARDGGVQLELVRAVVAAASPVPVQFGGGVRSVAEACAIVEAGAAAVMIATAAFGPTPLGEFVTALGDRLMVAVDVADDRVRTAGWLDDGGLTMTEALERCRAASVKRILCTAVGRDGTLAGPDLAMLRRARGLFDGVLLAAGGIRDEADVAAVRASGADGAVIGRAWLEGSLDLSAFTRRDPS